MYMIDAVISRVTAESDGEGVRIEFRKRFDRAFAPFSIVSDLYDALRPDFELISDELAGPMYSIREHGQCDYVFGNPRFQGVHEPDDFMRWSTSVIAEFRRLVSSVRPTRPDEQSDERGLVRIADEMEELTRLAYVIVERRWRKRG